jgi:dUTP pyrophosphatase
MKLIIEKMDTRVHTPSYGSEGAAGLDLCSFGDHVVPKHSRKLIPTGLRLKWVHTEDTGESPSDYYLRIAPRSGLSVKHSIDIGAGVVDSDYRGEVRICFINHSEVDYPIADGDRIAQGILEKINRFSSMDVVYPGTLNADTARGESGFGSTGK